jgi:undecaprenyl-diphosphatase
MTLLVLADPLHPENLAPLDTWWHDLALAPVGFVHALARGMGILGGDPVTTVIRLGVAAWLAVRRRWVDLAAWVVAAVAADLLVATIKTQTGRMRPDGSDLRSFPSGHAKAAAQIAVGLALLIGPTTRHRATVWRAAAAWIVVMSWSRTALDAHYLSDVIAGALIGGGVALVTWGWVHLDRTSRSAYDPTT